MTKIKTVYNEFFDVPKMPISFYLSENTIIFILINFLLILLPSSWLHKLFILIFTILGVFSYSWYCDYRRYKISITQKHNIFATLIFSNVIFNKGTMAFVTADALLRPKEYTLNEDIMGNVTIKQTDTFSKSFIGNLKAVVVLKLFLFGFAGFFFFISPFLHIHTIRKYKSAVAEESV